MYECFNMAYQDNANALQLHIKINSENLLPAPQKYNAGSLRIPADPSWPKIPQRKLIDDIGDAIDPPCIVTLTGTPRRSRTVVQTPLNQSPKSTITKDSAYSSYHNQRTTSSMQTLKKVPGYVDPRFKKVTSTQRNQVTSTNSLQKESNRLNSTMSAQHLHREEMIQTREENFYEEEKLGSTQNHREENRFNVNREPILEQNCSANNSESQGCYNTPGNIVKEKSNLSKSTVTNANTQVDIAALPVQENNGQLFFVLDKKLQNAIHVDTISVPKDYVNQCYNVQVPVLAYQKIPIQVSPTGVSNVIQQCPNSECNNANETQLTKKESERKEENINNPHNGNNAAGNSVCETRKHQESSDSEYYIPNINKKNMQSNVLQRLKMSKCETSGEETTDSEFVERTVEKRMNKMNPDTVHGDTKATAQNYAQINLLSKENEYLQTVPREDQDQLTFNYKTATCDETKGKNKSEQNLTCMRSECTRKLCRNSEPYITFKQRKASAKFSRKAKSYFQRNSHSALADSDYTLAWPNCQYGKSKRNQIHKLNHKVKKIGHLNPASVHERNAHTDNSRFDGQNYARDNELDLCQEVAKSSSKTYLQRDRCKCDVSPRSNIDDNCERTKGISPKTQELLNKSYWEYYNKLRHKIQNSNSIDQQYVRHLTIDPYEKGKRGKISDKDFRSQLKVNPELHTLEQCTALSTMINKALDSNPDIVQTKLHMMDNLPLNHKASSKNANGKRISNLSDDEVLKVECDEIKTTDKQFLELKSIIFFGGMMYILIIFLPMLHDYFYYEDGDDYENLSYLELIVDYILSSFKEAFGGIFDGVKQIFFYPVRLLTKSQ